MFCPNCGTQNEESAKFCKSCGYKFENNVDDTEKTKTKANIDVKGEAKNYFELFKNFLINPMNAVDENEFDTKKSLIILAIVSFLGALFSLVSTTISTVRVSNYSWWTGETSVVWNWSLIKDAKLLSTLFSTFIGYVVIFAFIAVLFYLGSLVIKKQGKYQNLLALTSVAFVPTVLAVFVSPILGLIYTPLSIVLTIGAGLYSFILLYEFISNSLKLEGNKKIFFFTIVIVILVVIYAIFILNYLSSELGELNSILDMLK